MLPALTIALGAFLLFLVEPMVARMLLPQFGGSAAVWITALLFFQLALLAGYAWAHFVERRPRWHLGLLAAACLTLPITPRQLGQGLPPLAQLLLMLCSSVALPFIALSATGPLLQAFRAREGEPWKLYALSNAASLLGLFSYPLLVEPALGLHAQSWLWSGAFAVFALLCAAVTLRAQATPAQPGARAFNSFWVLLPLCSSAMLAAVTEDLTVNVAPIPLLWVLPLAAYLMSFILAFQSERFTQRKILLPLAALAAALLAARFRSAMKDHEALEIAGEVLAFFCLSLALHGELVRRRPDKAGLTSFYLWLSAGSALGGALVAIAAPLLLNSDVDLELSLCATASVLTAAAWNAGGMQRALRLALCLGVLFLVGRALQREATIRSVSRAFVRDFYGSLRVEELPTAREENGLRRTLVHGTTEHGAQRLKPGHERDATAYYGVHSGLGRALQMLASKKPKLRVGIVGLGAGVSAAWCRPGDEYTFYEIAPLVVRLAREQFTFLQGCPGARVLEGDARLTLAAQPPQGFDLLAVDAFSADAVPTHLLTTQAFALYAQHLAPGGLLAMHVSNLYLSLEPVVAASAEAALHRPAFLLQDDGEPALDTLPSFWVLVPERAEDLAALHGVPVPPLRRPWTDDFSNVLSALDLQK